MLDPKIQLDIRAELTKALYSTYPTSMLSTFFIASILLWELSGSIKKEYLITWYLTFCIITVGRFFLLKWYRRTEAELELRAPHYYLFLSGAFLTALLWGILSSYLMPTTFIHQVFIIIVISGILAGSIQSLSPSYLGSIIYLLLIIIPLLTWQIFQILEGDKIYISISILMMVYCIFSSIITYHIHSNLVNHIRLKFENAIILKNLSYAKSKLEDANQNLKHYSNQIDLLSRMGEMLKVCVTKNEILALSSKFILQILPVSSGGLFLISKFNTLEALQTWGTTPIEQLHFSMEDCWAMRHQHIHLGNGIVHCKHSNKSQGFYECIPLKTHDENLGILYIQKSDQEPFPPSDQNLLVRIANDIALTIASIRYSELLKNQAMHDPLTGLFNRRFLEEYFETEIKRAERNKTALAVLMLDVDHFKVFNDRFGHETGDVILQELGNFLSHHVRSGDIVCRYGGEEFIIIMPESSLENAYERAEFLRKEVKSLLIYKDNHTINDVHLSFGISLYPTHGLTTKALINEADKALYEAKQTGRDRVSIAKNS